jgi:triacylglycerol lipase
MARFGLIIAVVALVGCAEQATENGGTKSVPVPNDEAEKAVPNPADEPKDEDPVETEEPARSQPCVPANDCNDIPELDNALKYPMVLAHGMGGFDEFWGLAYYVGVQDELRNQGYAAYTSRVDPMNGSDVRGKQLAKFIDKVLACTCADKVNILGHSQGGIDARYVTDVMGYGNRVASITTIAAPHHGTPVADALLGLVPNAADGLVDFFVWVVGGIYTESLEEPETRAALTWCSTACIAQFTKDYPPDPQVKRYSFAGRAGLSAKGTPECNGADLNNPKNKAPLHVAMTPGWVFLGGLDGVDNDGLVTVESAKYGHFRGCVAADHIQEIGMFVAMWPVFDHHAFYLEHVEYLADQGH